MKITRKMAIFIKNLFDDFLPPIIRDSKSVTNLMSWILFRKNHYIFDNFKEESLCGDILKFKETYEYIYKNKIVVQRETDLNQKCINEILKETKGENILEVGCGFGYLAKRLSERKFLVTACDIAIDEKILRQNPEIKFIEAKMEELPFRNNSFDTVVTTHTLEHCIDLFKAITELRRVAAKRIIIVVPKERPYRFTPNLHLHFFPYMFSLLAVMGQHKSSLCKELDGDLFYLEDIE